MYININDWEHAQGSEYFDLNEIDEIEIRAEKSLGCFNRVPKWKFENADQVKKMHKKWVEKNRESYRSYLNNYQKKRYKNDSTYRLNKNLSIGLWHSLKGKKAGRHWESLVGYTVNDLIKHLESQFWKDPNITWDNYGEYWQVDHIRPIASFNFKTAEDEEFIKCWSLNNLQPLEASENLRKSSMWEGSRVRNYKSH